MLKDCRIFQRCLPSSLSLPLCAAYRNILHFIRPPQMILYEILLPKEKGERKKRQTGKTSEVQEKFWGGRSFPSREHSLGQEHPMLLMMLGYVWGGRYSWNWLQRGRLQTDQGPGGERSPRRNKGSVCKGFENTKEEGRGSLSGGGTKFKSEAHRHLKGGKDI